MRCLAGKITRRPSFPLTEEPRPHMPFHRLKRKSSTFPHAKSHPTGRSKTQKRKLERRHAADRLPSPLHTKDHSGRHHSGYQPFLSGLFLASSDYRRPLDRQKTCCLHLGPPYGMSYLGRRICRAALEHGPCIGIEEERHRGRHNRSKSRGRSGSWGRSKSTHRAAAAPSTSRIPTTTNPRPNHPPHNHNRSRSSNDHNLTLNLDQSQTQTQTFPLHHGTFLYQRQHAQRAQSTTLHGDTTPHSTLSELSAL